MGNNQSRSQTNYKKFRITRKESHSGWARCYLDDYVTYADGNYKHMDFDTSNSFGNFVNFFDTVLGHGDLNINAEAGDFVRINMDMTSRYHSGHNFNYHDISVMGRIVIRDDGEGFIKANMELCRELAENAEMRARAAEYARGVKEAQR
jgi:hypothetical protein